MVSQINKIILKSLETGDKYGLEIIKDIQSFTNNRVVLKQPSLYSALRRMEKKGLISSFWEDSELGGRRHYYSLTRSGREELQADNVVSESDIQSILYEVNKSLQNGSQGIVQEVPEPVIKNKMAYEKFDPHEEQTAGKSFSQQVRKFAEPATIEEKSTQNSNINNFETVKSMPQPEPKQKEETSSFWRESMLNENSEQSTKSNESLEFKMDENKPSRFEINYKDILGDLDANKPQENTNLSPTPIANNLSEQQEQQQRAKQYSSQFSQIFASNKNTQPSKTTITKEQEELRNAIFKRQNQSTLDEIGRRYNLNTVQHKHQEAPQQPVQQVEEYSNLTKVSPSEIEVKQYIRDTGIVSSSEKEFININKLILARSIIMAFFFAMSVLISYFVFNEQNFIYAPHECLYWIALGAAVLYIGIMLAITLPKFNKKVQLKKINWFVNLFYRALIAVALFTFVIALCLCFGMTNFMQIEFFTIWYISALAIGDILVSWLIGYIVYSTKAFRE